MLCIRVGALIYQFALFSLISLVINTDDIRARSSLEPALIGHSFASNKGLALAQEASFTLLFVLRFHLFALGDDSGVLAVGVDSLEFMGLVRHHGPGATGLESEILALLVERTQGLFGPLMLPSTSVDVEARLPLRRGSDRLDGDWLHVEGIGR